MTHTRDAALNLNLIVGLMSDDFRAEVVQRALERRKKTSGILRKQFQTALRKNVRIDGFRPHKANNQLLLPEILRLLPVSSELVGSILQLWIDSHSELYEEVFGHLSKLKMPTQGIDFSANRFAGSWNTDIWQREKTSIVATHSHFKENDVALMLCCVSGNLPEPDGSDNVDPAESRSDAFFPLWLEELRDLPADAPQWQQADDFVASATEIIQHKTNIRSYTLNFNAILAEMKQEVGRELAFFQIDPDSWSVERLSNRQAGNCLATPEEMAELLRQTESLKVLLTDYKPVHDIAPTIEEEVAIWPQRGELQRQILVCLQQIYQLFSDSDEEDHVMGAAANGQVSLFPDSTVPPRQEQVGSAQIDSTQPDDRSSSADVPTRPPDSTDTPAAELSLSDTSASKDDEPDTTHTSKRVRSDETVHEPGAVAHYDSDTVNASLEAENSSLRHELKELRDELKTSQDVVRLWRIAYEEASKRMGKTAKPPSKDKYLLVEDVRTAVALAKEKYAGELTFQPNSKSEIEDSPYEKPTNVLAALEWLATTFYRSKVGEVRVTDLNKSIKKVCGWSYTGRQSTNTMKKYEPWYTTSFEGEKLWLKWHVGTGSNKDSRYTIRIAFDWDKDRKIVVIGYIGQHQRTDAT
ncbi:MAG: hypothetical protein F4Z82_20925 [Caldilineaceae bacterium SB0668_bin_21]|nr:hypothetical protein [Caldilineaceae bacterium SB0668_bin_21]MYC22512.1 hypothetical protein [Caldilineaceae bacterium SB0662_bin_25]